MSAVEAVIQELQSLLAHAKQLESRTLSEILALERIVNQTQKCVYCPQPKEFPSIKDTQKKEVPLSVEEKVNALMNDIEARQKIIETEKIETKPKFQTKLPEIVVEKKPPIPTANRNERALKIQTPAYVPPRNKNEVTGKVTQSTMRTSGQKVFRPEKTSTKKVETKEEPRGRGSGVGRSSVEKPTEKREMKPDLSKKDVAVKKEVELEQPAKEVKQEKPPIYNPEPKNHQEKVNQTKKISTKVKFATFHKDIEEVLSEIFKSGPKNHKPQLQKLLSECESQEKGHRMHEDNTRRTFIKKLHNYAVSRHAVYPMSSYDLPRNPWPHHSELPDLHLLLDSLENELTHFELQRDCRIDKKSQYRISQSHILYSNTIAAIRSDYDESRQHVPEMLELSFDFAEQQPEGDPGEDQLESLTEVELNGRLLELLEEIGSRGTLEKSGLRGLQVLSEVGMFGSKRTPLVVMEEEYLDWKAHYSEIPA